MNHLLSDTWFLFQKYLRINLRMPLWSLFGLIQPLLWLFIFGALFSSFAQLPGFPTPSYIDFLLPGVVVMTVLFGSSWSGVSLLREIDSGVVDKMLVSPVSRTAIVLSRVLHSAAQVLVQCLLVLLAGWLYGAQVTASPLAFLGAFALILLLAVGFASLSNGLAMLLQREEPLVVMGNMMTLPLMFFSSALVPATMMPDWIRWLSAINPIEYAVSGIRLLLIPGAETGGLGLAFAVVGAFALATTLWAVSAFNQLNE